MKGFYRSKYTTPSGEVRYAAVTQFEVRYSFLNYYDLKLDSSTKVHSIICVIIWYSVPLAIIIFMILDFYFIFSQFFSLWEGGKQHYYSFSRKSHRSNTKRIILIQKGIKAIQVLKMYYLHVFVCVCTHSELFRNIVNNGCSSSVYHSNVPLIAFIT